MSPPPLSSPLRLETQDFLCRVESKLIQFICFHVCCIVLYAIVHIWQPGVSNGNQPDRREKPCNDLDLLTWRYMLLARNV